MESWQRVMTTIWSSLLAAPVLFVLFAFSRLECGEMDNCPTGGAMPVAAPSAIGLGLVLFAHAAFLFLIWKSPGDE